MKEWKKEATGRSPRHFAERSAGRVTAQLQSPCENPNDLSGHDFSRAVNATKSARLQPPRAGCTSSHTESSTPEARISVFSARSSNSTSFTSVALTNREETVREGLKSVSVRKNPGPLFSITYGYF